MNFNKSKNNCKLAFEDGFNYAIEHLERKCPHFMYESEMECMWYNGYDSALRINIK